MRLAVFLVSVFCVVPFAVQANDDNLLKLIIEASSADQKSLKSIHATGKFQVHRRPEMEEEEKLWTDATFEMWVQEGKVCLDIIYHKKLVNTRLVTPEGLAIEGVGDEAPERVMILVNASETLLITWSPRINPAGCLIKSYTPQRTSLAFATAEFPIEELTFPQNELIDFRKLIDNLGTGAIELNSRGDIIDGTYRIKNSKSAFVNFQIDSENGYRLIQKMSFNDADQLPVKTRQLIWSQKDTIRYVSTYQELTRRSRKNEPVIWVRTRLSYDEFLPNEPIDDSVFRLNHYKIPPGTRTLNR